MCQLSIVCAHAAADGINLHRAVLLYCRLDVQCYQQHGSTHSSGSFGGQGRVHATAEHNSSAQADKQREGNYA